MNKQETYQYLKDHNIPFEITEHPAGYNMEDLESIDLPYPEGDAKTSSSGTTRKRIII